MFKKFAIIQIYNQGQIGNPQALTVKIDFPKGRGILHNLASIRLIYFDTLYQQVCPAVADRYFVSSQHRNGFLYCHFCDGLSFFEVRREFSSCAKCLHCPYYIIIDPAF